MGAAMIALLWANIVICNLQTSHVRVESSHQAGLVRIYHRISWSTLNRVLKFALRCSSKFQESSLLVWKFHRDTKTKFDRPLMLDFEHKFIKA